MYQRNKAIPVDAMSILKLFLASVLLTKTVYGLDPSGYNVKFGDPFLLFPFLQEECADPSAGFVSAIQNKDNPGFDTLMKGHDTTISCPEKGDFKNAANGVILTNDASGDDAGLMSTGTLGDSGFVNSICLQTTTNDDGKEVCEGDNIQFAVEFWFDYQPGVTFPDTTSRHILLEISDNSEVFFQIAYEKGSQFTVTWNDLEATGSFTDFEEGLNHVLFVVFPILDLDYFGLVIINSNQGGRISLRTSMDIRLSTATFTSNAKLRIGNGITDSNFKTAIYHVTLFNARPFFDYISEVSKLYIPEELFKRGLSNSYPVTNHDYSYATILEDETEHNITVYLELSSSETFDFNGDNITLELARIPTLENKLYHLEENNNKALLQVGDVLPEYGDIFFQSNAIEDYFNINDPQDCSRKNHYSSFELRVRDQYGAMSSSTFPVYVCVLGVEDPLSLLQHNSTLSVLYGEAQRVELKYSDPDGLGKGHSVTITSDDNIRLTVWDGAKCTNEIIPLNIAQTVNDILEGETVGTFELCVQLDLNGRDISSVTSETVELKWRVNQENVGESEEGRVHITFLNPRSTVSSSIGVVAAIGSFMSITCIVSIAVGYKMCFKKKTEDEVELPVVYLNSAT